MNLFASSSNSTTTQAIDTPSLRVTTAAQVSGAITAIGAAAIALIPTILGVDTSDPIKIALIGLVGAGILAWAIAAAGDTIARAYAAAHVTRTKPGEENQPALHSAAARLADAYAATHGLKPTTPPNAAAGEATAAAPVAYSPSSPAAPKECCLEFSPPLQVKVRGKDAEAVAVLIGGESGKETQRYLVGLPGSPLGWVNSDAVSMPDASPSSTTATAAQPPSTATASKEWCLELSPPLRVNVGPKDGEAIAVKIKSEGGKETQRFYVGTPGNRYSWVVEDAISMRA